ncbi:hypothetical protein [Mycoplasma leonicaptivi]|uniref:hypothetical protein n=1 Tax=Mycoplasma leonicaptivi TaxID=36742 RepID=UPI000480FB5F|nr:hypothetical protein [Mycoplasma leonicaptivi]
MLKLFFCYRLNNLEQNNPQKAGFESNNPTRVDDAITRYNDIDKANFKEDAQDQINLLPSTLPQGDTGQTLQQIFNARLTTQDTKEHFASVRSEVLTLLGEHTKATSAINDLPHQGNRSALANELLKADTVQKVTEILAKVTPLREKIQQAQDKLSGTSENPGVSQQNATGLRDELNAADTLEKAQAVLEKIEAALAKDEQDRQYAQSQTNGTNALNELPEGSRALFQEQLNNARTKEATEAVIVKIREFKQEQDTTRQNIVSNITSENNRAKLLEDLNNVQSIDGFEAIKQRERDLTAKIAEVKEQIELILVSDRNDYWNVKLQEHFNENVSTIKNNLTNVLNEARELDGNDDTTRLSQFENTKQLAIEKANVAKEILTTMNDNTGALLLSELNNASDSTQIQTVKSKIAPLKQAIFDFWRPYKDSFSIIIDASRNKNEPSIFVDGQKYKNINDAIVDMLYSTTDATQFRNSSFALRNMYVQNHKYWQEAKTITSTTAKNTFNQRMVALTKVNQFAPLIQEVQQYKTKETELTTKINQFTSESKKAHFNSLLNNATNKARVEEIIALIDTIETKKTETTQANNTLEDQDLKAQFSTRINDATSVEQLQQIANEIETAKQNYQTKRQETTNLKDSLTNVNQKNHYNTRITSARSTTELNQIITEINQLKNKNTDNQRLVDEFNKYFVHLTEKKQQIQNKLNEVSNLEQANAFENAYNDIRYDKNNSITKWAATVGRRISDYNHPDAFVYIIGFQHNRGVQNKNIYFVLEDTQNRNNIITISDPKTEFVPHSQIEINDIFTNNSHTTTSNAQTQNSNIANSKLEYNKIYELKLIYSPDGQYRTTTPSFNSIINTSK